MIDLEALIGPLVDTFKGVEGRVADKVTACRIPVYSLDGEHVGYKHTITFTTVLGDSSLARDGSTN